MSTARLRLIPTEGLITLQGRLRGLRPRRPPYRFIAIGGTFDVLHKGHEEFFTRSFALGENVFIGVTSDKLVRSLRKTHPVQRYKSRVRAVRSFLRRSGWTSRAKIFPLRDSYGPAATTKNLQAIVITPNTLASAKNLNRIRKRKGLRPVVIRKVRLTSSEDGRPISSTRIRNGEIDRTGRLIRP